MESARRQLGCVIGLLAVACSRSAPEPQPFLVARTSPQLDARSAPLLLNDSVTVYFTADVLPVSVTPDSVTLLDERGERVPGTLHMGANWVTFQPQPPLASDLSDGSFRPGATYRLMVAGSPRPDAVRASDGRRLAQAAVYELRVAGLQDRPHGLPAPLRPPAVDLPFLLHTPDVAQPLPADAPRLQLHFSQPLLPSSVTPDAFEVTLLDGLLVAELVPRRVRVVTWSLDALPGSSVEIDLGAMPRRAGGGVAESLRPGNLINVGLRLGSRSLLDYGGRPPLQASSLWSVVPGGAVALAEWPAADDQLGAADGLSPTFEARGGGIRPRVRVEAGDGSLGVFRPRRDTVLRPGVPFDRGDGQFVVSVGNVFPFLAIDVPAGVTVRIEANDASVQLLCCGSARLEGKLELAAAGRPLPPRRQQQPVRDLALAVPVSLIAAGDIRVPGQVVAVPEPQGETTCLLLASAGSLDLRRLQGDLPFHTMLAFESGADSILGPRGQSVVFVASFTYGVAPGGEYPVQGETSWRQLPLDRDGGVVHVVEASPDLQVAWQSAPPDPVRRHEPDTTLGRVGRLQPVLGGETLSAAPGSFVRFALSGRVRAGQEPPRVRELRISER